jgi:DNA-binding NtrC family response regulator
MARSPLRILVVDDDERCLESLHSFLSAEGHVAHLARRGLEAVDMARAWRRAHDRIDVSILDYHMPDLNGIETFARIADELPGMQAIILSGEPSLRLESEVLRIGALALVRKPPDLTRVRSLLAGLPAA